MVSDIMVKDHSDSERGNLLLPHGQPFLISSKGSFIFYIHHPTERIDLCYTSCGNLGGVRTSSMGPP